jgi:hypothetical protein
LRTRNIKKYILIASVVLICTVALVSLIALNLSENQTEEADSKQSPQLVSISGKLEKDERYLFAKQLGPGTAGYPMFFIQPSSSAKYYLVRSNEEFYSDSYFWRFGDGWWEGIFNVTGYKKSGFYECIDKENDYSHTVLYIAIIKVVTIESLD